MLLVCIRLFGIRTNNIFYGSEVEWEHSLLLSFSYLIIYQSSLLLLMQFVVICSSRYDQANCEYLKGESSESLRLSYL